MIVIFFVDFQVSFENFDDPLPAITLFDQARPSLHESLSSINESKDFEVGYPIIIVSYNFRNQLSLI